jgi:hypothetical protein
MFDKFLNEFAKNVRHIDAKMAPIDQMRLIVQEKIDYAWLSGEKVRVSKDDAKLILSMLEGKGSAEHKALSEMINTEQKLRSFVRCERARIAEDVSRKNRALNENVSTMFEMMRNLKYLPGLEKVTSVNNTVDGMEATAQAVDGASYHFTIKPVTQDFAAPPLMDDASLARSGDGEKRAAIHAMRRAATTMVSMGIGRNEEKARLHIQTVGVNQGLPPIEAAELARKILAKEMGERRRRLG